MERCIPLACKGEPSAFYSYRLKLGRLYSKGSAAGKEPSRNCGKRFSEPRSWKSCRSVAAGVILRGDQDETRPRGLRSGNAPKRMQDPENGGISSQDPHAHGSYYGEAQNEGHKKRIHVNQPYGSEYQMPQL